MSSSKHPSKKKKFIKKSVSAAKKPMETRLGFNQNQLIAQTQLNSALNDPNQMANTSKGQLESNQLGQDLSLIQQLLPMVEGQIFYKKFSNN